ncbi:MAG: peptidylprolyl isomerase [Paraglaciecola sp.]|uniref:peptidylprolyl isomerase n=1 Tax=Paraglaciecola sp. TaxID=1920173 RepID=UPI003297465A
MKSYLSLSSPTAVVILIMLIFSSCDLFTDKAIKQVDQFIAEQDIDKSSDNWKTKLPKPPVFTFTEGKTYLWKLATSHGDITVTFKPETAPMHVSSTIYLTKLGFYNGLLFHRIIPGFMAQGGDPLGTGRGNPGYAYEGEFDENITHSEAGKLSMANAGPNTDGSQFFLTFSATPWLNGKHTIFGDVTEGIEVLATIESLGSRNGRPSEEVSIINASVVAR